MSSKKPFQGNLETMPLSNILQWLADSKKTGSLTVTIGDEEKQIALKNGIIVNACSNLEKERFGNIIIKKGYVTQKQVEGLLEEGKQTGKLLGKLCVEKGLIPEDKVKSILLDQMVAIIESLLHRSEGRFVFIDEELDESEQIPLSIAVQELFFGSAGKRKEWQRIYDLLGSLESVPKASGVQTEKLVSLSEFQHKILSLCDGKRRILDILAEIDEKDFIICQALADLVEKKWVHIDSSLEKTQKEYQERIWQVYVAMEQKRFLRANLLLDDVAALFPERFSDLQPLQDKALRFLQEDMDNLLSDESVELYRKPGFDQSNVLARSLGPKEWFIYSRAVDKIKLKDLILMTGLPKEAARRAIYALIDAGAIELEGLAHEEEKDNDKLSISSEGQGMRRRIPKLKKEKKLPNDEPERPRFNDVPQGIDELNSTYRQYLKMNHYQLLGVTENSSQEDIRNAFVRLSRRYHPDMYDREKLNPDVEEKLEELFSMVNHAYRIISNIKSRERYDKNLWVERRTKSDLADDVSSLTDPLDKIILKPKAKKGDQEKVTDRSSETPGVSKKQAAEKQKTVKKAYEQNETEKSASQPHSQDIEKTQLFEAVELYKQNKFKDAINILEGILRKNPRIAEAYYYLSRSQLRLGGAHMNQALDNIKRALILEKENPSYFCQIARVYIGMEMHDEAERYLKTALAWDADDREAKYLLEKVKESQQTGFFTRLKKKR
ncbi:MAG: DUF4388 domain-containing protein [bacterium]